MFISNFIINQSLFIALILKSKKQGENEPLFVLFLGRAAIEASFSFYLSHFGYFSIALGRAHIRKQSDMLLYYISNLLDVVNIGTVRFVAAHLVMFGFDVERRPRLLTRKQCMTPT